MKDRSGLWIGLALAVSACAAAMGAEQLDNTPDLPGLDELAAAITTDTVTVAHPTEFRLSADSPELVPIVLEFIVTHPIADSAEASLTDSGFAFGSALTDQTSGRYVSIFEPLIVTISISYLPGEHSVSFDSRPPGMLALATDAVLHFPSDEITAAADGLAVLTTTQTGLR